ncbi:MAG: MBL fold metallo-hydrolase [Mycoplasmatales bacterium]
MNRIIVLEHHTSFDGKNAVIYPVVIQNQQSIVLVDGGYPDTLESLDLLLQKHSLCLQQITHFLITHYDYDHMGVVHELSIAYPHIQIVASSIETPYLNGLKKNLRITQTELFLEKTTLSPMERINSLHFIEVLSSLKPISIDIQVEDGTLLPWGSGCKVIGTPGHTPGHISLYFEQEQILIAGDAAIYDNEKLKVAHPKFASNRKQARESFKKIIELKPKKIICHHGGEVYLQEKEL